MGARGGMASSRYSQYSSSIDYNYHYQPKSDRLVEYPIEKPLQYKCDSFKLFGVVVHRGGSIDGGHYIAYVRSLRDNGKWYVMNDSSVRKAHNMKPDNDASILLY